MNQQVTVKDAEALPVSFLAMRNDAYESDMRDVALRCAVLDYQDAQRAGYDINRKIIRQAILNLESMLEAR